MFFKKLNYLKCLKICWSVTRSILGLGLWSMDQNVLEKNDLPISGVKNKGCY